VLIPLTCTPQLDRLISLKRQNYSRAVTLNPDITAILKLWAQPALCVAADGMLVYINPAAKRALDITSRSPHPKTVDELFSLAENDSKTAFAGWIQQVLKDPCQQPVQAYLQTVPDKAPLKIMLWSLAQPSSDKPLILLTWQSTQSIWHEIPLIDYARNTQLAVMLWDTNMRIIHWNEAAERLFGYTAEEIAGLGFLDSITPMNFTAKAEELLALLLSGQGGDHNINENITKDGRRIICEWHNTALRDEYGQVIGFISVTREVTEQIQNQIALAQNQEFLNTMFRSIGDAVIVTDPQARILRMNRVAERLTGWPEAEARGLPLEHVFEIAELNSRRRLVNPALLVLRTGQAQNLGSTVILRDRHGQEHVVINSAAPIVSEEPDRPVQGVILVFHDVSHEHDLQQRLIASEYKYKTLVETTGMGYAVVDHQLRTLDINDTFLDMLARRREEVLGQGPIAIAPHDQMRVLKEMQSAFELGSRSNVQVDFLRPDGSLITTEISGAIVQDKSGPKLYSLVRDVTQQREAAQFIRQLFQAVELSPSSVIITDILGRIVYVNPKFEQTTGYTREEVLGKDPSFLVAAPEDDPDFYKRMLEEISQGKTWSGEIQAPRKDGEIYWEEAFVSAIKNERGVITHYLVIREDITQRKLQAQQLHYQAHYDALTGLPNRILAQDRLDQALARAARASGKVALFFIDLDRFKAINDTLGHKLGDNLLAAVAARFKAWVRAEDTVARLGGDEFLIILVDQVDDQGYLGVVEKLQAAFLEPVLLHDQEVIITPSIGIAIFPDDAEHAAALIKNADAAMYEAKQRGRNAYYRYTTEMNQRAMRRMQMERRLRQALVHKEGLHLAYQPIINLRLNRIIGAEAFLHWHDEEWGDIEPSEFIAVAEDTGLIQEIGQWAFNHACQDLAQWQAQGHRLSLSINISAQQIQRRHFTDFASQCTSRHAIAPQQLILEVTESLLLNHIPEVEMELKQLHRAGFHLALDDFGTGYSSLSYLRRFPFDSLKIDRQFIHDLGNNQNDCNLILAMITMAHSLGMTVVAEGIENPLQLAFLLENQCDFGQGFFFAPPMPAAQLLDLMNSQDLSS